MHELTPSTRGKRLMQRIHTLRSEDGGSAAGDFDDLDFPTVHHDDEEEKPTSSHSVNKNLLFAPSFDELKGEKPPHEKDLVEKIRMRGRSQSWMIRTRQILHEEKETNPLMIYLMFIFSALVFILSFPLSLLFCIKVIKEYQRAVVFRLGRLIKSGTKGPGLFFILPCIDTCKIVDLRILSLDVPPQEILSRDTVTVLVEAVIYFRVSNPVISVTTVNDAQFSTRLLAQTTLRNVLGTKTLSEMLSERDAIANITEKVLDEGTVPWGVKVERVEIKDIRLPHQLMRSLAAEALAVRRARAAMFHAEGEKGASKCMSEAADMLSQNTMSIQLRYLSTLQQVAAQKNRTIVIPYPMELARNLVKKYG
ncbi:unnamed protein product [Cylicocyclus nassatus]|uniref:Band 7 domain-containing protein n=1 Tax=Cylicocyclus nassatus TaxID=53992 RepID=A0AA36GRI0_CYLNA|nr:unnamed protein product [Cylicocyclus nassatus]